MWGLFPAIYHFDDIFLKPWISGKYRSNTKSCKAVISELVLIVCWTFRDNSIPMWRSIMQRIQLCFVHMGRRNLFPWLANFYQCVAHSVVSFAYVSGTTLLLSIYSSRICQWQTQFTKRSTVWQLSCVSTPNIIASIYKMIVFWSLPRGICRITWWPMI